MLYEIFIPMTVLSLILITISYFYDRNYDGNGTIFVRLTGWLIFFLMTTSITFGGIDYNSGDTAVLQADNVTTITSNNYTNYADTKTFMWLPIMAGFGFVSCFFELKKPGEEYVE